MIPRKRLVFCTYPSAYSSIVLDALLKSSDIKISAIIISQRNLRIHENAWGSDLRRIKHSGIHYACYLWLVTSIYSLIGSLITKRSISAIAKHYDIPMIKTRNINDSGVIANIKALKPDFLLCAHFNQLVSKEVYSLAKDKALNIHPSLLPDLKGVDPGFYALNEAYTETGVSLHELDKKFDEGKVVSQGHYPIKENDTLFSLNRSLFKLGAEIVLEHLNGSPAKIIASNDKRGSKERYDSWPDRTQVSTFRHKRKLISYRDIKDLFY